jgi:hypothetical protein
VRAVTPVTICVFDDAQSFLKSHPEIEGAGPVFA